MIIKLFDLFIEDQNLQF